MEKILGLVSRSFDGFSSELRHYLKTRGTQFGNSNEFWGCFYHKKCNSSFQLRGRQNCKYYKMTLRVLEANILFGYFGYYSSISPNKKYQALVYWILFSANGCLNCEPIKDTAKKTLCFPTKHTLFLSQSLGF